MVKALLLETKELQWASGLLLSRLVEANLICKVETESNLESKIKFKENKVTPRIRSAHNQVNESFPLPSRSLWTLSNLQTRIKASHRTMLWCKASLRQQLYKMQLPCKQASIKRQLNNIIMSLRWPLKVSTLTKDTPCNNNSLPFQVTWLVTLTDSKSWFQQLILHKEQTSLWSLR